MTAPYANWSGCDAQFSVAGSQLSVAMELTVYSAFWCPDCREAKRFLRAHNIPFKDIDIETTPGAADEVIKRTGLRAIPQFVIDGEWVQPYRPGEGFLYKEMAKRLGVAQS
jgi:mycoredoxin